MCKHTLIIAGSRSITNPKILETALEQAELVGNIKRIISGTARGVDTLGEHFAERNNIELIRMPADWNKLGNRAGSERNIQMAIEASRYNGVCVILWDGKSVVSTSILYGLTTYLFYYDGQKQSTQPLKIEARMPN